MFLQTLFELFELLYFLDFPEQNSYLRGPPSRDLRLFYVVFNFFNLHGYI